MIKLQKLSDSEQVEYEEIVKEKEILRRIKKGAERLLYMETEPMSEEFDTMTIDVIYKGRNKFRLTGDSYEIFLLAEKVAKKFNMSRYEFTERVFYKGKQRALREVYKWVR